VLLLTVLVGWSITNSCRNFYYELLYFLLVAIGDFGGVVKCIKGGGGKKPSVLVLIYPAGVLDLTGDNLSPMGGGRLKMAATDEKAPGSDEGGDATCTRVLLMGDFIPKRGCSLAMEDSPSVECDNLAQLPLWSLRLPKDESSSASEATE
jgi:hypothetical protein